jgi:arylsulfatase A-like enzyme
MMVFGDFPASPPRAGLPCLLLALLAAHPLAAAESQAAAKTPSRPNIIHIMADDLGWRDLSCYGSETFQTPNIDALARRGMIFSNAYSASPLCSPTRAATLTGQTVGRLRFTAPTGHGANELLDAKESTLIKPGLPMTQPDSRTRMPLDSVTYARLLKAAGYRTGFMGKWHLGHKPYLPEDFGFDVVVGGRGTPGPPDYKFYGPWKEGANFPPYEGNPNADDILGDAAVKFIKESKDAPFLLNLWLYNVHAPFQGDPEYTAAARPGAAGARYQKSAIMAAMVKTMDDNVGKVMAALNQEGLLDNTMIIFTSDNGGNMYQRPEGVNPTDNHPLRAGKGNGYEGGMRVPAIVSWPGVVPAGSLSEAVCISYDWFPTFLEATGLSAPKDWPVDGKSLMPALRGEAFERGPVFSVFPHTVLATGNYANTWVRDGQWKLMRFYHTGTGGQHEHELYDLSRDPGETTNLATRQPDVTERLAKLLDAKLAETQALLPRLNPGYDPELEQHGIRIVSGGLIYSDKTDPNVIILAKERAVTLRFRAPADAPAGDSLELDVTTNCAVGVTAGPGEQPVFAKPVAIIPNGAKQTLRVPLGRKAGTVTLVFDLEQPGEIHIGNPHLR